MESETERERLARSPSLTYYSAQGSSLCRIGGEEGAAASAQLELADTSADHQQTAVALFVNDDEGLHI